jgi:hypothetical protein
MNNNKKEQVGMNNKESQRISMISTKSKALYYNE